MAKKKTGKKINVEQALDAAGLKYDAQSNGEYIVNVEVLTKAPYDELLSYLNGIGGVTPRDFHVVTESNGIAPFELDIYTGGAADAVDEIINWAAKLSSTAMGAAACDLTDNYLYTTDEIKQDVNVGVIGNLDALKKEKAALEKDLAIVGQLETDLRIKYDYFEDAFANGKKSIENIDAQRKKNDAEIKRLKKELTALKGGNFSRFQDITEIIRLYSAENKVLTKDKKSVQYKIGKTGSVTRMVEAWGRNELQTSKIEKKYKRASKGYKMPVPLDRQIYLARMRELSDLYIWLRGEINRVVQAMRNFQNTALSGFVNGKVFFSKVFILVFQSEPLGKDS